MNTLQKMPAIGYAAIHPQGQLCLPVMRSMAGAKRCAVWYAPISEGVKTQDLARIGDDNALNTAESRGWTAAKKSGWRVIRVIVADANNSVVKPFRAPKEQ